jgi:hypothetical protein
LKDALLRAGVVRPEETPEARSEQAWQERRQKDAEELAARTASTAPLPSWEAPPSGQIVGDERAATQPQRTACTDCGEPFDPDSPEHKPYGRNDQCVDCARNEDAGPTRKRGQMVWTHKTAPTLEIEGAPPLTPEELAAMRRR